MCNLKSVRTNKKTLSYKPGKKKKDFTIYIYFSHNTELYPLPLSLLAYTSLPFGNLCFQVELLILSHHFYKSSACLDGVDVLVALAATRVEAYVSEGDFSCLARLITGVGNFHALNFILGILIENGQLDLLLQKYSAAADTNSSTAEAVRGFRMAVLTSLKQFNPNDLDAFAMVCIFNHDSLIFYLNNFICQSFVCFILLIYCGDN